MIGILLDAEPNHGGVFQYSRTVVDALTRLQDFAEGHEGVALVHTPSSAVQFSEGKLPPHWSSFTLNQDALISKGGASTQRRFDAIRRLVGEGVHREVWRSMRDRLQPGWRFRDSKSVVMNIDQIDWKPHIGQTLREFGIDMMLYPTPHALSFECGIPFIMAIPDLQHRIQPEFPEVSASGEWARREYIFRNAARYATLLLADSQVGKEDILHYYQGFGATADRVHVLPFLPAACPKSEMTDHERRSVLEQYGLIAPYFFYPAQFWPHKNHLRIVQAIALASQRLGSRVHVAFAGSKGGSLREQTFAEVIQTAQALDITTQVHYLGYAPDEHMAALYQSAMALIMPTFFGPTNIPPLEAWAFGCPVITSDIRGIRDQMGDAAILVDPRSVESIATAIQQIWTDDKLRQRLVVAGQRRLASYTPDDFRAHLCVALEHARRISAGTSMRLAPGASSFAEMGS